MPYIKYFLVLAVSLFFAGSAIAYDTPKALVEAIYQPYQTLGDVPPNESYFSTALYNLSLAKAQQDGPDSDDAKFDPFINGQAYLLHDLKIHEPVQIRDRAVATVSFFNFDQPVMLNLFLVREAGGWKVDDIASSTPEQNWLWSWLLQYDPFATQ